MTRVFVVGSEPAARARVAALCRQAGVEVIGHGPAWSAALTSGARVLVLAADRATELPDDGHDLVIVVISDDPSFASTLARGHTRGWAVLPGSARADDLALAVTAAVRGFALSPAEWSSGETTRLERVAVDGELVETLTPREIDVLELVALGRPNRDIAKALGISEHTVKFHLASVFGKLGASTRTEAVRRGLRRGLITI